MRSSGRGERRRTGRTDIHRECFEDGEEMSDFPEKLYSVDPPNQSSDGLYMIVHTKKTDKYTVEYTRTPPTPPDEEGEKLVDMSTKSLKMERERFQAYIDGPENDHRTTSYGSASLDYWMDTIEDIDRELERRRILSLPKTEREKMSRLSQHEELVRAAKEVAKIISDIDMAMTKGIISDKKDCIIAVLPEDWEKIKKLVKALEGKEG